MVRWCAIACCGLVHNLSSAFASALVPVVSPRGGTLPLLQGQAVAYRPRCLSVAL